MTNITISTIQIKRGTVANMPTLLDGELYHAYDEKAYYIGQGGVNQLLSKEFDSFYPILSRLGISANNKLTIDDVEQIGGNGSGLLVYNTLTDLQTAYPNGTTQPVWITSENAWYYWSGTVVTTDTTPPNDVTNLAASNVTSSTLTLSWTASTSTDIASYDIYQGSTLLGNVTGTTYNVTGLTQNTSYTFTVKAKDTSGNVATGTSVTQLTATAADTTAPNNVTNLTTSNISTTSVTLNWTASNSSDVASYDIYNGSTFVANTANTSYTVTGLTASTQYTLTVKAKDSSGNVASGTQVTFTTTAPADTTPPVITASPAAGTYTSSQSVTLSSNETGTTIYYTTDGTTPTTASTVYSGPITISATETIQFIGKDSAGNISTPVAATYTINVYKEGPNAMKLTGASASYIKFPSVTFNEMIMEANVPSGISGYLFDARSGASAYITGTLVGANVSGTYINGVQDSDMTTHMANIPKGVKSTLRYTFTTNITDDFNVFSDQSGVGNSGASVYTVKLLNNGTVVAFYDFSQGFKADAVTVTIPDASGNNKAGTLYGGLWTSFADASAPTITNSLNGGTYASAQTVTLTPSTTADIYYTLDGTPPNFSSTKYTGPITINSTSTLWYFAVDSSTGAMSSTTKKYYNIFTQGSHYANFTSGYAQLSSMYLDEVVVEISANSANVGYLIDARAGLVSGYVMPGTWGGDIASMSVDGTSVTASTMNAALLNGSRHRGIISGNKPFTDDVTVFAKNDGTQPSTGSIYAIHAYRNGVLKASFDFTNTSSGTTVADLTGNGNTCTITNGTWA